MSRVECRVGCAAICSAVEPISPMVRFEFRFSDEFLREAFRRNRRSRAWDRWWAALKVFLALVLIALMIALVHVRAVVVILGGLLAFLLLSFRIDEWWMTKRFRKSPYRDELVRISLSPEGFSAKQEKGEVTLDWSAFTRARRFSDGVLLFQGPGVFNWLPFKRMTSGKIEEVDELVGAKIKDFKNIERARLLMMP